MTDTTASAATAARADETSRALLDAAHDLLGREGPAALTVRRIAAAAGMSTMNVYSRFGGKDGVLDRLFIDGFERLAVAMDEVETTADPVDDLRRCGEAYRRFARRWPTYYSLMFDRVVPDYRPTDAALVTSLATLRRLVERVERAIETGAFAPGDPFSIACGLWALQHGVVSLEARTVPEVGGHHDERHHAPGESFDWAGTATLTVDATLDGLRSRPAAR